MVTAGPTYEPLDPVRFIGNHSSGKMGIALCEELARRGASVQLVLGPSTGTVKHQGIKVHKVRTAQEMYDVCVKEFEASDIAIMSAAVADYTPAITATQKIKKDTEAFTIELTKTKDILKTLGEKNTMGSYL